jgi:hypothetical protein
MEKNFIFLNNTRLAIPAKTLKIYFFEQHEIGKAAKRKL